MFQDNCISIAGKRKLNENCKKSSKNRQKALKNQKAEDLVQNVNESQNFVGGATMIIDQPISQVSNVHSIAGPYLCNPQNMQVL